LDIGCAIGELSYELSLTGVIATGIDLNDGLLNQAQNRGSIPNLKFQKGDMLELENDFQKGQFDSVLCFGNTLVHLSTTELVGQLLKGVFFVLKTKGVFLLQILNYDYIVAENVSELPVIENEHVKFVRKYFFEENSQLVRFKTDLYLKEEERIISNETTLLALKSDDLYNLIEQSGFSGIEFYSDFKQNPFGGKHIPFVIKCIK
jgi:2-polyprenyl-3-methyl-5-hydroxy-6-metoxy-1,4-benzoquinol methylase